MRVLAVTHSYPRFDGDLSGAFLERLYEALVARGHTVQVIAPADEGRGGEEVRRGVRIERVRYAASHRETLAYRGTMASAVRRPAGLLAFRGLLRALQRALRARAVAADVIHANWWVPGGWAARRAARRRGIPYVVTLHGTDAALLLTSRFARWVARPVLRDAAAVTAVSSFLAGIALRAGASRPPAVLTMPLAPRATAPTAGAGRGIVTVGRLTAQKRIHLLIDAVAELRRAGQAIPLTIVGDGPERTALETAVQRLGVQDQVRFAGAVPPDAVPALLDGADVFVFPARHEGLGLAAVEALMAGVPVIVAQDGGGVLDVARPESGAEVVPVYEPGALAAAITRMLGNGAARAAAAAAGQRWQERLRPEAVAQGMEAILEAACRTR